MSFKRHRIIINHLNGPYYRILNKWDAVHRSSHLKYIHQNVLCTTLHNNIFYYHNRIIFIRVFTAVFVDFVYSYEPGSVYLACTVLTDHGSVWLSDLGGYWHRMISFSMLLFLVTIRTRIHVAVVLSILIMHTVCDKSTTGSCISAKIHWVA